MPRRSSDRTILYASLLYASLLAGILGYLNQVLAASSFSIALSFILKTMIEVIAGLYAALYLAVAVSYRRPETAPSTQSGDHPDIAVVYLCCDDLDAAAIETIAERCAEAAVSLWVHDDSSQKRSQAQVDATAAQMAFKFGIQVSVLRRPTRGGGKPAALNNVVSKLPECIRYILVCDSDTYLYSRSVFAAARYFDEPDVALVQFRTIGHVRSSDGVGYRLLAESVTFYDAFISFLSKVGSAPFLGHNALIRLSSLRAVGGFTPGQLADDIDLWVRLRLVGQRAIYAREVICGERHPETYRGLRLRTEKWAYGCTQILMHWGSTFIFAHSVGVREKLTFLLTVGYYHFHIMLLVYILLVYAAIPLSTESFAIEDAVIPSIILVFLTFLPSLTYFASRGEGVLWLKAACCWGLTYGSQEIVMARAVTKCLLRRSLHWNPTNGNFGAIALAGLAPELMVGAALAGIAAFYHPETLLLPTTLVFVGKFLTSPLIDRFMFVVEGRKM